MTDPGCAICAEALARLDGLLALIEQRPARGAVIAAVPELAAAVVGAVDVLAWRSRLPSPAMSSPEVLP